MMKKTKQGTYSVLFCVCVVFAFVVSIWEPLVLSAQQRNGSKPRSIVIRGQWVWDGTGKPAIPGGVILIQDDRIVAVGREEELTLPADALLLDRRDLFLMPGMVDSHEHFSMDQYAGVDQGELQARPATHLALRAAQNGRTALRSGVTTARILTEIGKYGGKDYVAMEYKQAFNEDLLPGPRIIAARQQLHPPEGFPNYPAVEDTFSGTEELRRAVREDMKAGADFCKMYIGGNLVPGPGDNSVVDAIYFTKAEIEEVISECHRHGKKVTAHVIAGGPSFEWAVAAGIDCFEHGILLTREEMQKIKEHDIFLSIGGSWLFVPEGRDLDFYKPYVDQLNTTVAFRTAGQAGEIVPLPNAEALIRAWYGLAFAVRPKIVVGADGFQDPGALAKEVAVLVRYGLTNEEALLAATRNGGELSGLPVGTLEPGKYADVIGVRGNPLKVITALQQVEFVMKGGKVYALSER